MAPVVVPSKACSSALAALVAAAVTAVPVEARLGGPGAASVAGSSFAPEALAAALVRGGPGRGMDFWRSALAAPATNSSTASRELLAASAGLEEAPLGYQYLATTTIYANTDRASCGGLDTAAVVSGTDFYAVASAQAMQNAFPGGGCCWCGGAGASCGEATGTAPMGCMSCAKGRFLPRRPYDAPLQPELPIFLTEINIVVADICPHQGNEAWCPQSEGSTNVFGSKNHFDFAAPPLGFDNYYFAFTPTQCPPELQQRLAGMSKCGP